MILLIAVLAFLSAAFLLIRFSKRRDIEHIDRNLILPDPPLNARPLFEPTDEELRTEEQHKAARLIARREYHARSVARAAVDEAQRNWRSAATAVNASELLRVTAESGVEGDFARAGEEIIAAFNTNGIDGLGNDELAALLDSHIGLLSQDERASGAIFWLRQEAAKFRSETDQLDR